MPSSVLYGMSKPTLTNARKEIYEFGNSNGLPELLRVHRVELLPPGCEGAQVEYRASPLDERLVVVVP